MELCILMTLKQKNKKPKSLCLFVTQSLSAGVEDQPVIKQSLPHGTLNFDDFKQKKPTKSSVCNSVPECWGGMCHNHWQAPGMQEHTLP